MLLQNLQAEIAEHLLSMTNTMHELKPATNLSVYQNNIQQVLKNALSATYPLIVKLVGQDFFAQLAAQYIQAYPSRSANIHEYGEYLSYFLKAHDISTQLDYLPEVASFEWTCHSLTFAAEHEPFNFEILARVAPEKYDDLHFKLHPASALMLCHYPLFDIIDLCLHKIEHIHKFEKKALYLCILRREHKISLIKLKLADYLFLSALNEGETLQQALAITTATDPLFKLDAKLSEWINLNILVDCYDD